MKVGFSWHHEYLSVTWMDGKREVYGTYKGFSWRVRRDVIQVGTTGFIPLANIRTFGAISENEANYLLKRRQEDTLIANEKRSDHGK